MPSLTPTEPPAIARELLARYARLIDDPQDFLATAARPLPTCLWVNPFKIDAATAIAALHGAGANDLEAVPWYSGAYRSCSWRKPGRTLAFACGWYFLQEEIALSAVAALDPQPSDRVLDLCAAPGGKSAQIAARLGATGTLVANEFKSQRLPGLQATLQRLGSHNTVTVQHDGRKIPLPFHSFDKVLVDAPCSGEGTLRKHLRGSWRPAYGDRRASSSQQQLLDRALQLVKPGGIVVYSTCTFAPEENEAILDATLGDRGVLEPITLNGLRGLPGLSHWEGRDFRADLTQARRFFPHFNDTGGFFVARIRRTGSALSEPTSLAPVTDVRPWPDRDPLAWLGERFGWPTAELDRLRLWTKSGKTIWAAPAACEPLPGLETIGLPLARLQASQTYKPTTTGLQRWGSACTRNWIDLPDVDGLNQFLAGGALPIKAADREPGYVCARYDKYQLGCGLYRNELLRSQFPKHLGSLVL